MFSQLKKIHPNLEYINELFEKIALAIANNQPDDVLTQFGKIDRELNNAYLESDDQLITCVIHHQIELVKYLAANKHIDYIALALKLNSEQALEVASMTEHKDQNILGYFILNRIDFPKLALDFNQNKKAILPLKNKILENLERTIPEFTKPLTQESLIADLIQATKDNNNQKIAYLITSFKTRLEMLFYKKDAFAYAKLIHLLTSIDIESDEMSADMDMKHYDALSFNALVEFICKDPRLKINWMLIHMTDTYLNAREQYDMAYQDILEFRITVDSLLGVVDNSSFQAQRPTACLQDPGILNKSETGCINQDLTGSRGQAAGRRELTLVNPHLLTATQIENTKTNSKEISLSTFEDSLAQLQYIISNDLFNKTNLITILFKIYCTFSQDILMNQPERFAQHLQQLTELIYANSNIKLIRDLFSARNIQVPSKDESAQVDKQLKGYLSLAALNSLPTDFPCRMSGMRYDEYLKFNTAIKKELSQIFGTFIPTPEILIDHLEKACTIKSALSLAIIQMEFAILIQECYLNQDAAGLSKLIADLASYLINMKSERRNLVLIQLLKIDATTTKLLFKALRDGDRLEVQAILTQVCLNLITSKDIVGTSTSDLHKQIYAKLGLDVNKIEKIKPQFATLSAWENVRSYDERLFNLHDGKKTFSQCLLEYNTGLTECISQSNYEQIEQKQISRRLLLDYAYFKKDADLYCSLLESDLELINKLWDSNHQAEIAALMYLNAKVVSDIEDKKGQVSAEEIMLGLLNIENFNYNVFYPEKISRNGVWAFKAEVCQKLAKKVNKNLSVDFSTLIKDYQEALASNNIAAQRMFDFRLSLLFSESLYLVKDQNQQVITQMAAKITLILQQLSAAYQTSNKDVKQAIGHLMLHLTKLDLEILDYSLKNKQFDLLAYKIINTIMDENFGLDDERASPNTLFIQDKLGNEVAKFTKKQDENDFDLLAIATGISTPNKQGLISSPKYLFDKMAEATAKDDFVELRKLCSELDVLIQDCVIKKDSKQIALIIKNLVVLYSQWQKDNNFSAQLSLMSTVKTNNELWADMGESFDLPLLYCSELSNLTASHITHTSMSDEEKKAFFKAIYNEFDVRTILDLNNITSLTQKPLLFNSKVQALVEYAGQTQDAVKFSELVSKVSDLIQKAYQENQLGLVLQQFDLSFDEYLKLFICLTSNHRKGIQDCICDYYLKKHSNAFSENNQKIFVTEVHGTLGIDKYDLILIGKNEDTFKKGDYEGAFSAFRTIANRKVDILKFPSLINILAKSPDLHQLLLKHVPTEQDNVCYHRFHEMMLGIWHTHIATHIFSPLKPNYSLNNFEVKGDGSALSVMCQYAKDSQLELIKQDSMCDLIKQIHSTYFEKIQNTCSADQMLKELGFALEHSVIMDKDHNVEKSKGLGIIAIPVTLKEGIQELHAVAAVNFGDILMLSDRGGYGNFSGMTFYKVNDSRELSSVLATLMYSSDEPISRLAYENLQKKLKLTLIDSIELDYQVSGNCGLASQAEPISLGILYFKFYQWALLTGRSQDDAMSLANYLAAEIGTLIKSAMENRAFDSLMEFFNQPECTIEMPRNLLANLYLVALYRLKNYAVASRINQSHCINTEDIEGAILDIKQHQRTMIEQSIPSDIRKNVDNKVIDQQVEHLTTLYLNSKVDQSTLMEEFKSSIRQLITSAKGYDRFGFFAGKSLMQELKSMTPQRLIYGAEAKI